MLLRPALLRTLFALCAGALGACSHQPAPAAAGAARGLIADEETDTHSPYATQPSSTQPRTGAQVARGRGAPEAGPDEHPHERQASALLARFVLARGIRGRTPVDEDTVFADGEPIFAFVQLREHQTQLPSLRVRWETVWGEADGAPPRPAPLSLGDQNSARAWAKAEALPPGRYRCVLETRDGAQIAARTFEVKGLEPYYAELDQEHGA